MPAEISGSLSTDFKELWIRSHRREATTSQWSDILGSSLSPSAAAMTFRWDIAIASEGKSKCQQPHLQVWVTRERWPLSQATFPPLTTHLRITRSIDCPCPEMMVRLQNCFSVSQHCITMSQEQHHHFWMQLLFRFTELCTCCMTTNTSYLRIYGIIYTSFHNYIINK